MRGLKSVRRKKGSQMLPWSQLCFVTGALNKPGCQNAQVLKDSLWAGGSDGKYSARNAGDQSLISVSGISPGEGNGYPIQYFCLENPMDRKAWLATVHGVANS